VFYTASKNSEKSFIETRIEFQYKCFVILLILQYPFSFSVALQHNFWALVASMKLSASFQLLDLGQSAGLLGRMISSSQGLG
jgi:hypothetical protein